MTATHHHAWIQTEEARVLTGPLLAWLVSARRYRDDTDLFVELPWAGRRVDVVTVSRRLRVAAFELKLRGAGRVFEQALYNRAAFDRSYMVVDQAPSAHLLREADTYGIGVLQLQKGSIRLLVESPLERPSAAIRTRLLNALRAREPVNYQL